MVRRFLKIFLIAIFFLLNYNFATAETILKVGYIPETGFLEEDRAGHYKGYGYEYMEFLSRYGDWKFEYIPFTTWNECNEKLQNGTIDLLPAMPGDYRSLQNVTRTDHVIGRYPMELITHDGKIHSQMRIGTIPANAPLPSLPKVAANEGFNYELVNFNTFYDMQEAFQRRELDGYIAPMLEPNKERNVASIFDRQSYRLLVRTDRKDLLAVMNVAMDEMLMDQPNIRNRLNDKYLRTGGFPLILNRQEKDYLAQKKKLKTAILMKDKPYAYLDNNGELHGVIPKLIKTIAEDLNIEIEIVPTDSPKDAEQLIRTGQIDFIADCVCDFSWAGQINMAPTQAYLQLEYVAVNRRGVDVENLKTVACAKDLLYTKNFVYPRYSEDNRIIANDLKECFKLVSEGKADIVYAPRSEIPYIIEETGTYNLETASESEFVDELSLGVSTQADRRLWRILNKEVNHLDISKIRNTVNEDLSVTSHKFNPQYFIYHYPLRAMSLMATIVLIIAAGVWYRMQIKRKHTATIHHIAYTDARYNLPNILWLEKEAPKYYNDLEEEERFYIINFSAKRFYNSLNYDQELRDEQIKNMVQSLNKSEIVLLTSTGNEPESLYCLCKAKNDADISRFAKESIRNFGYIVTKDSKIWLNLKAGICHVDFDQNDLHQSIEYAKIACQLAENDTLLFNSKLQNDLEFEKKVESLMENALKNEEFQVWYQPEYDLKTHQPIGSEAFIRWQSEEFGFLMPGKFISIFEKNGFIISTDYFVLDQVCKLQKSYIREKKSILPIAVNQSQLHLTEENYLEKMRRLIEKYKIPKGMIKLEFNERCFEGLYQNDQRERMISIMKSLQKMGYVVSIDNFGAGYSSYKMLDRLQVDEIKIDRSLLYLTEESPRMLDILESILKIGERFKIRIICEGIETPEQEKKLMKMNFKYGQGFLNAEPKP